MAGTIGYFFLGLHVAADRARNPFAHGKRLFQTVTESQHKSTKALNQMWNSRQLIFESASIRHDAYNTQRLSYWYNNISNEPEYIHILNNPHNMGQAYALYGIIWSS